ncbi:transcription initiation factor TFIID subunit 4-like isoform X1 [Saccostrea echinata]|uniref:transcription initiation factor TFIID subunit 4-like isoform X1 n=1 Tax=Saccostrea echinata TaxID=191078 RepID=UPI002A8082B2|nr:transcription initiation factor TFIID subunit 4-like isoform X1 [Saccostrea echinata]
MATTNSLDDILSTEIDENAVNALVGSLESQLASTTHKDTAHSISDASMNNNHISNANAPVACTSTVYLHSIPTPASKNMTIQNNVALNNANISHLKASHSDSQLLGLNSIVSNVNSSEGGGLSVNANNINRNSPVPVNHVRIVSQSPTITNSRNSPSPSVQGQLNSVSVANVRSSTPNQVVINNGQNLPNVNSANSANFNANDHKPVIRSTHNSPLNQISSQDVKPGPTQIVNIKHEPVGSPQTGVLSVKQETGSPSSGFGVKQEHHLAIQPVPGAPHNVPQPNVQLVQGKGPVVTGNPSVITVRTPGQTHPSQVVMQPQLITTQSSSSQMHVVSVSGCTVATRPTGTVQMTQGKNINPRMTTAAFRPQQISIAPRPGTTQNTIALPPGVQIPPGAQIVRNEQGQLVFVIQQPPATSATGHRMYVRPSNSPGPGRPQQIVTIQPPNSALAQQGIPRQVHLSTVSTATPVPSLVRTAPPGTAIHSTASGRRPTSAPQQPPDNVKKCKNFLSTLIKLAQSQPPQTVKNVRELIQGLIDGKVEPQTFTEKLQIELRSSPQPYLVPFLKKSLPALRQALIANTMTIDGVKPPPLEVLHPVASMATLVHPQVPHPSSQHAAVRGQPIIGIPKTVTAISGKTQHLPGVAGAPSRSSTPHKEKTKYDSLKDDDDINDVATMGGVNLSEESKNILASNADFIGTQIRSCKDEAFLHHGPLLSRITAIAKKHGLDDISSDVANLVSHATQERLRDLLEKLDTIAEHRIEIYKMNDKFEASNDAKSQLKFLEELDKLEKKRHDDQEWEKIMKAAKSRSKNEDPEQQKIKQKAKELQQAEIERMRQEEANQTALAAIGPRKKRKTDFGEISTTGSGGFSVSNGGSSSSSKTQTSTRQRIKRVTLRDVLFLMEQERSLGKSTLLYKTFLK